MTFRNIMIVLLSCSVALPTAADAAQIWAAGRKITYFYAEDQGIVLAIDGASVNPNAGCDPHQLELLSSAPNYDVIAASLLTAFMAGSTVDLNYDNAVSGACRYPVNRAIIYR